MKTGKRGLSLIVVLLLAGCATSLPEIGPEKLPPTPAEFKERWTIAAPAAAQPRGEWWKAFNDPVLDALIERANAGSTGIQVAAARLAQARAAVRTTDADRALQAGVGASATRAQGIIGGDAGPARNLFATGVDLSYEVDLFGRLSHASQAAVLDAQGREALLQSARLLVQAQVAQAYLALRALDAERELVRNTVGAYRATLALTERRWRSTGAAPSSSTRLPSFWAKRRRSSRFLYKTGKQRCRRSPPGCRARCSRAGLTWRRRRTRCSRRRRASAPPRRPGSRAWRSPRAAATPRPRFPTSSSGRRAPG